MLHQLYEKFSDNRTPIKSDLRASKFYNILMDPFNLWCNFHADPKNKVYENSAYDDIRYNHDMEKRRQVISERYGQVFTIEDSRENDKFKETLSAMIRGEKAVQYAELRNLKENILGTAHMIEKKGGQKSIFGNYYYRVILFKGALELKDYYALQACLLTRILAEIQGVTPKYAVVVLKNKEVKVDCSKWSKHLEKCLKKWQMIKEGEIIPELNRPPKASGAPWRHYANKRVKKTKDLVMIPALGWDVRAKLKENGLNNIVKTAKASVEKIEEIVEDKSLAQNIYLNSKAYILKKPVLKAKGFYPPKTKKINLYFDFESSDELGDKKDPYIYLIGLWDKEKKKYVSFLADGEQEEEKIFEEFINYVSSPENTNLYHWTEYEIKKIKKISEKYPKLKKKLKKLLSACVDLKVIIKKSFYLPAAGFSLKTVAPEFGFKWRQKEFGAMDAMAYYWKWLKTKDKEYEKKILDYNEDDCVAMLKIDIHLRKTKPVIIKK